MFKNTKGQIIILGLVFMAIISLTMVSFTAYEGAYVRGTRQSYEKERALSLAEAGLNKAIWQLNQTGGVYNGETFNLGAGAVTVQVTDIDSKTKILTATASIPNEAAPQARKEVRLKVSSEPPTTAVSFHYGVQVGEGGLEMEENSKVTGNIYSNGNIVGDGVSKSIITGDAWVAGGGQPVLDQSAESYNSDFIFGQSSPQIDAAQSFQLSTSAALTKTGFLIKKVGSPSNLTVYLVSDNNGKPSKDSLAQATLRSSLVTGNYFWVEVSFSGAPVLPADATYWLLLDGSRDSDDYWVWAKDGLAGYSRGAAYYSADWQAKSPVWSALNADLAFRVWLGGATTSLKEAAVGGEARANTIINAAVGGDAYFQVLTNTTVNGVQHPGSADPAPQDFPISNGNISDWKNAALAGGIIEGDFHPEAEKTVTLGPKKIIGNLILDNKQTLILTGTVWVQGYIKVDNNAAIRLDSGYGSHSGVIVTDSWIHLDNNGVFGGSGDFDSYLTLVSLAACPGGEQTPACTNHNAAVDIHNNVDSTIFYAPFGLVYLHNLVRLKEVTAYKIHLSQNVEITYESGLASATFTNGPAGAWQAVAGFWQEIK